MFHANLIANVFRRRRNLILVYFLALSSFMYLIAATFPTVHQAGAEFMEALPPTIKNLVGDANLPFASLPGYLGLGLSHPLILVLFAAFIISSATQAVAGEIDRRTADLILSRPVSRTYVLASHLAVTLIGLFLLALATWLGVVLGAFLGLIEPDLGRLALASLGLFALFFAVAGYAYAISALTSDTARSNGLAAGLTSLFFFMHFIGNLWDRAEFLLPFTIFTYYTPGVTLEGIASPAENLIILFTVGLVLLAASFTFLNRRDIA
ncbi:MAG: ABC transporter permease subunit [Eubacteriales bacterium]|jgi:ABC-2 type transport system permease protein|nr:ABC transporter permease [Bacillota bacterium]MBV1727355.1 ABC transporter permease [Desulforudis sp.]MDQ7789447.1 ABC transporter permease subunit [Clostridia bacterium]MDZ4043496.1 ABC transporter permease subunit [Eubacteriales bacterium]MBU4533486.1 ABC transporter permease [Bacillota bacterium]